MTTVRFDERPAGTATMAPDMPGAVNYYNWISSEMAPYLGQNILDIGGGYGAHLDYVLKRQCRVLSIDFSEGSVQFMRQRFQAYPKFEALVADFGKDQVRNDLVARQFDTITCLNVLEHIEDDLLALKEMNEILDAQQGTLFLQIPSHQWLYGSLDSQAGHYRRYNADYLRSVLHAANFQILHLFHFNSFGVLPWFINARVLKRSIEAKAVGLQIKVFDRYFVPVLSRVEKHVKLPFGQSLMAVARARKD